MRTLTALIMLTLWLHASRRARLTYAPRHSPAAVTGRLDVEWGRAIARMRVRLAAA